MPHATTGLPLSELLIGRKIKARLDLIDWGLADHVQQHQQKRHHDQHTKQRTFNQGDTIYAQNYTSGRAWVLGEVVQVTRPVSYKCKLDNTNGIVSNYMDQRWHCYTGPEPESYTTERQVPTSTPGQGEGTVPASNDTPIAFLSCIAVVLCWVLVLGLLKFYL